MSLINMDSFELYHMFGSSYQFDTICKFIIEADFNEEGDLEVFLIEWYGRNSMVRKIVSH